VKRIKIVTDSVSCVPKEIIKKLDIKVVPFYFKIDNKEYKDGIDIDTRDVYKFVEEGYPFRAYPPKVEDFLNVFNSLKEKEILCITLSSTFSACIRNCKIAKEMVKDKKIEVIDSLNGAAGEGLLAIYASRLSEKGKKLTEIVSLTKRLATRIKTVVMLDTIKYVFRTGRIPKTLSNFGSLFSLKPILMLHNGKIKPVKLVRNKDRGIQKLLEILLREKEPLHVVVMHADDEIEGRKLVKKIKETVAVREIFLTEFTPIMGFATGKKLIGVSFYSERGEL